MTRDAFDLLHAKLLSAAEMAEAVSEGLEETAALFALARRGEALPPDIEDERPTPNTEL